jgi:hypothetical protein
MEKRSMRSGHEDVVCVIKWTAGFQPFNEPYGSTGPSYFGGPRFIKAIQEIDPYLDDYVFFMEQRKVMGRSTSRRDYFKDILMDMNEGDRVRAVVGILNQLQTVDGNGTKVSEIRAMLGGGTLAPNASIPADAWNGDRLNEYLKQTDAAIAAHEYERAVTLSYACFEGFLGAFVRAKEKRDSHPKEIITLAREVKDYLKRTISEYPDEVLNSVTQAAFAVDRSRNRFSESHFASEAGSWLATYVPIHESASGLRRRHLRRQRRRCGRARWNRTFNLLVIRVSCRGKVRSPSAEITI